MKKLMLLFFGLFFAVAGFGFEGERNEVCVEDVCVEEEFVGGEITVTQGFNEVKVIVTENIGNNGSVLVFDDANKVVYEEYFDGNDIIVVDVSSYPIGDYRLVATAGTTVESLVFSVR